MKELAFLSLPTLLLVNLTAFLKRETPDHNPPQFEADPLFGPNGPSVTHPRWKRIPCLVQIENPVWTNPHEPRRQLANSATHFS